MAKVTRSTRGAQHVANRDAFNGAGFTAFNVEVRVSKGRAERLAMKTRLAEAKQVLNLPVSVGHVRVETKFAFAV